MNKVVFNDNVYLKKKDIIEGKVYIMKSGVLVMYLGISNKNEFVFYTFGSVLLDYIGEYDKLTLANYDWQSLCAVKLCELSTGHLAKKSCVRVYKTFPSLYGEFTLVDFVGRYKNWWLYSYAQVEGLPVIPSLVNLYLDKKIEIDDGYVRVKDLVPGNLYYTGQCWRSTYVYLGRDKDKNFLWYFVGNEEILLRSTPEQLKWEAQRTKSNKKVKNLAYALQDKNAYVSEETKRLISMNYNAFGNQ